MFGDFVDLESRDLFQQSAGFTLRIFLYGMNFAKLIHQAFHRFRVDRISKIYLNFQDILPPLEVAFFKQYSFVHLSLTSLLSLLSLF
jgi:hypothetical protein